MIYKIEWGLNMKKNRKKLIMSIVIILFIVIALPVMFLFEKDAQSYTWEDYEKLSAKEKAIFPDKFNSMEEYNEWYSKVSSTANPDNFGNNDNEQVIEATDINDKGKKVSDYTWEDYQKLSDDEKAVFPDYFESMNAYKEWYKKAKEEVEGKIKIDLGGKDAKEFTWKDYEKLSLDEKAVFPDYFESMDEYYKWYESVEPKEE